MVASEALEKQREAREKAEREAKEREAARLARSMPAPAIRQLTPSAAASDFEHAEPGEESDMQRVLAKYSSMYDKSPTTHVPSTNEQGRKRIEIPYIPPEQKPTPPPNDGSDPFYYQRMAYYKVHGGWPTNEMLSR